MKARLCLLAIPLRFLADSLLVWQPVLSQQINPPPQPADLVYDEMRTVYLGNLARRDNGRPPLRWNREMTNAAR